MSFARIALLPDRGVARVTGPDAEKFLNGSITADLGIVKAQAAVHSALLTPQGKMLFEFFVTRSTDGGFLLETGKDLADELVKRLKLFRLRAKVEVENVSAAYEVAAAWGDAAPPADPARIVYADPRLPQMGWRMLAAVPPGLTADDANADVEWATTEAYHEHRIALGVPEAGKDYSIGDTFPHEADLDLLNGVSFTKGCFVGQEVVSRMKHRGTARRRVVPVQGDTPLASGVPVMMGEVEIGRVGSVAGTRGLAMVRLDRAAEAGAKGVPLTAGGVAIALSKPGWAPFDLAPGPAAPPAAAGKP
jgi:folate-binding protein YgfZ